MEVIHLRSSSGYFGAESVIITLLSHLKDYDMPVTLLILKDHRSGNTELLERARDQGINTRLIECHGRIDRSSISEIASILADSKNAILHTHDVKSNLYGYIASKRVGNPLVATLHGWTSDTLLIRLYEKLDRWIISNFDRLVSVSDKIVNRLGAATARKVVIIPNGVDTSVFRAGENGFGKVHWGIPGNHFVFGIIARLTREKGHELLLEAFAEALNVSTRDITLLIIGEGPEEEKLRGKAKTLGIDENVVFGGSSNKVNRVLHDIDCYVSASYTEGMPMIILEAMASGIPVIGTAVGSVTELLSDDNGKLVSPGACDELADAMVGVLGNQEQCRVMQRKALDNVQKYYSARLQAGRYMEFYKGIEIDDPGQR